MGDADDDADVILLRAVRSAIHGAQIIGVNGRELADQITGAIIEYVRAELCSCATNGDCPLRSHL